MRLTPSLLRLLRDARGAVLIYVAVAFMVLLAFTALAIDIGYAMVARNELQNVADAAALASTRSIGKVYEGLTYEQQQAYTFSSADILSVAKAAALKNQAAGTSIELNDADVLIGKWDGTNHTLGDIGNMNLPDAVRVIARRDSSSINGPVTTFFARVFGQSTMNISATATAALTGQSTAGPGGLPVPLGISQVLAGTPPWCGTQIVMSPTRDSCAGWHTFTSDTHSAHQLDRILQDYLPAALRDKQFAKDLLFVSPAVNTNDTLLNFTGGDLASDFGAFDTLFNYMKTRDGDGNDNIWTTAIVIYKETSATCGNPTGDIPIVGFATMQISEVVGPSDKTVYGQIQCGLVDTGRGGGGNYGTKGSIPGLVQ